MAKKDAEKKELAQVDGRSERSLYKPEYCEQLIEFMEAGGAEIFQNVVVSNGREMGSSIQQVSLGNLPALFQDFEKKIGVCHATMVKWRARHPEFGEAWDKAKAIQCAQMIKGGLSGAYKTGAFVFAMKNMHGWRDTHEVEHSGNMQLRMIQEAIKRSAALMRNSGDVLDVLPEKDLPQPLAPFIQQSNGHLNGHSNGHSDDSE